MEVLRIEKPLGWEGSSLDLPWPYILPDDSDAAEMHTAVSA